MYYEMIDWLIAIVLQLTTSTSQAHAAVPVTIDQTFAYGSYTSF